MGEWLKADIHEGLETTVTVLAHKIKHTEIKIDRDYDRTLPALTMHGSELNQVWTNLLDNAIDALGDRGRIAIGTARDGDCIRVRIADDGPGIPPEIRDRVFEPFFTTKDVGQGTGLGLEPPAGSSRSAMAALCRSPPARPEPRSPSGCRSPRPPRPGPPAMAPRSRRCPPRGRSFAASAVHG